MQNTADRITTLTANRDALSELINPYFVRIIAGVPLTTDEQDRYEKLTEQWAMTDQEIDAAWQSMVAKKRPLHKRLLRKH